MSQHAFLAIPAHSAQVHVATLTSIMQSGSELRKQGIPLTLFCWAGDSLLPHARNALVAKFLSMPDCTDMVFVDSDISWEPGTLLRLLSHDVDYVAGAYRFKRDGEDYPVNHLPKPELWADPETGLLEVADVPTGFLRLRREGLQKFYDAYSMKSYRHGSAPDLDCRCMFDLEYRDGQFYGEDFVFSKRWRDLGGKVWVDPELAIRHHDGGKTYAGHFGNWLRAKMLGPMPAEPDAVAAEANPAGAPLSLTAPD